MQRTGAVTHSQSTSRVQMDGRQIYTHIKRSAFVHTTKRYPPKENMVSFTPISQQVLIVTGKIKFHPSVYNANGTERRLNLLVETDLATRTKLREIEVGLGINNLTSIVKDAAIKCKIDMDTVRCYDAENRSTAAPTSWAARTVEIRIEVRGTWHTATNSGLSVSCTDVRFMAHPSPFA